VSTLSLFDDVFYLEGDISFWGLLIDGLLLGLLLDCYLLGELLTYVFTLVDDDWG
jgi:hypothetical protein